MPENKYKRILLKLSGEALAGENKVGIDFKIVDKICEQVKELVKMKTEVAIVEVEATSGEVRTKTWKGLLQIIWECLQLQ